MLLDADWNTTLPLYFGSAKSIHDVGGAQPFSANSFLLYAMPVIPSCTPAPTSSFIRANGYSSFSTGESSSFWHTPRLTARAITPSSRNATWICGLFRFASSFASTSDDVPGTITTLTLFAFSKSGSTWLV